MRSLEAPSSQHIMGTDVVGRDVLSRLLYGIRPTLFMALTSVTIGGTIGTVLGMLAGYNGGIIEAVVMRTNDLFLAFPGIVVALVVIAIAGTGLKSLVIALSILSIPSFVRIVHGNTLTIRRADYVLAAKCIGGSKWRIVIKHILPNISTSVVSLLPIVASANLVIGSSLSFFGLGVQPPTPELGLLAAEGRDYIWNQPYLAWLPGLIVMIMAASLNLVAQGLRNAFDPHSLQRARATSA
jgi:ABC-type dipeptide/oligopeptide/nickel transport system permease subunit